MQREEHRGREERVEREREIGAGRKGIQDSELRKKKHTKREFFFFFDFFEEIISLSR